MRLPALFAGILALPLLHGAEFPSAFDIVKPFGVGFDSAHLVIQVDTHGDVYIGGTLKADADIPGAHRIGSSAAPSADMFVIKMDPLLEHVQRATIIGGSGSDGLEALKIDADGNILIAGYTTSVDLPLTNRLRPEQSQGPVVLKLNPTGEALVYGVRLGDLGHARFLEVDSTGAAYVAGETDGPSLTSTPGAYLAGPRGGSGALPFVLKLNSAGSAVELATFLSAKPEPLRGFAVNPDGVVAFVTEAGLGSLNFTGTDLRFRVPAGEFAGSLGMDGTGNFYVTGGATLNDSFRVQKFSPAGVKISTFGLTASGASAPIQVTRDGRVLMTGLSTDAAFPTRNALLPCRANRAQPSGTAGGPPESTADPTLVVYAPDGSVQLSTPVSEALQVSTLSPDGRYIYAMGLQVPQSQIPIHIGIEPKLLRLELTRLPAAPRLAPACLASAATYQVSFITPGELMTIYGSGLGPETGASFSLVDGRVPTALSGTTVTVDQTPVPILYTQDRQINFIAPWGVRAPGTVEVCVQRAGGSACLTATANSSSPGAFQADGRPLIVNEDGTLNGPFHPARSGSYVVIYFTGAGLLEGGMVDGAISGLPLQAVREQPYPFFNGGSSSLLCADPTPCTPLEILYFGSAPGLVSGVTQMNLRLPPSPLLSSGGRQLVVIFPVRGALSLRLNTPFYGKP